MLTRPIIILSTPLYRLARTEQKIDTWRFFDYLTKLVEVLSRLLITMWCLWDYRSQLINLK